MTDDDEAAREALRAALADPTGEAARQARFAARDVSSGPLLRSGSLTARLVRDPSVPPGRAYLIDLRVGGGRLYDLDERRWWRRLFDALAERLFCPACLTIRPVSPLHWLRVCDGSGRG